MVMSLQDIKERYAIGQEYSNWESFINDQPNWKVESIMDDICEIHKKEAINEVLDNKWISVKDRLPEENQITDVYLDLSRRVTNYKWENFDLQSSFMPHSITHWMPLPEPPNQS